MILHLLISLLILGVVESQTANMTHEVSRNQTFTADNSALSSRNVHFNVSRDEWSQVEDKVEKDNKTSGVITEDDETFQEQEIEFPHRVCDQDKLVNLSHRYCGEHFRAEMLSIGPESWCVLENVIRPYNDMALCLEILSHQVGCYYPNSDIQGFFVYMHSLYFHSCEVEEEFLHGDAPHELVLALTLVPVSLIPILVYLVVWKSKVQE